jgi:hypothetical protein
MKLTIAGKGIKTLRSSAFALLIGLCVTVPTGRALAAEQVRLNVTGKTVPTTKILAVGLWTPKATADGVRPVLPAEVRDTVRLYLDGVIDQWFIQQDNSGVVFLLNVTETDKARALLEKLPLGQAGLMVFQLTQLGPVSPLASLIGAPAK